MSTMRRLLRSVWAIFGVLLFLLLLLVSIPWLVFNMIATPGARALRRNIWFLHHVFTPFYLACIGIRLQVEGLDKIDPHRSYILVGNHRSSLDFIVNAAAFPGVYRYLAKKELTKIPLFGWVVRKMCLMVDRENRMSRARSIVALRQQLAAGWSVFIYPEGSRNHGEAPLGDFYEGAFRIALQTGTPIAVQTIVNIGDVIHMHNALDLRPGRIRIVWDGPFETAHLSSDDAAALSSQVRACMLHHLAPAQSKT
jgi:1-acyl-sn-glycerol-3-phosphate acyltransferase